MSYYSNNPYYSPEAFGLTIVGVVDRYEPCYDFDMVAVWWHEDGRIFVGTDSGCSRPAPFEGFNSLDELTLVSSWSELQERLQELTPGGSYGDPNNSYAIQCGEIISKVRDLL